MGFLPQLLYRWAWLINSTSRLVCRVRFLLISAGSRVQYLASAYSGYLALIFNPWHLANRPSNRHLTLILTTIRYGFSWLRMNYYGGMAVFSYRTSFIAAALTYGIVVYKTQKARAKTGTQMSGGAIGLLSDENVQYLCKTDRKQPVFYVCS